MAKTKSTTTTRGKKVGKKNRAPGTVLQSPIINHQSEILLQSPITPGARGPDHKSPIANTISITHSALQLLPYQQRWIEDNSPLKIVVKARQIGYSFASTLRVVLECLKRKTTWILLSKGERQSRLLMEKVQEHIQSCGIVARACESEYFEGTTIKQLETRFPNGSVIYGLPANPDTARGYSGNVTLDEFAFHADAGKIYSALYPSITRGYSLEVISTPNGQQGKFYELAKQAGLDNQEPGVRSQESESGIQNLENRGQKSKGRFSSSPDSYLLTPDSSSRSSLVTRHSSLPSWSAHWCDIYDAVRQGLKIDLQVLRAGCEDDTAWRQEFGCQFVSTAENFFPPELLAACLSAEASLDTPTHLLARESDPPLRAADSATGASDCRLPIDDCRLTGREFYLGIDIGRRHDRTVFWVDEVVAGKPEIGNWKLETGHSAIAYDHSQIGQRSSRFQFPVSNFQPPDGTPTTHQVSITRLVRILSNVPFNEQMSFARHLMGLRGGNGRALICRAAIDATGMGAPLAESLAQEFGERVEPVVFTAAVKEDLAYRTRRRMENGLTLLPDSRDIRRAFSAVKKFVTVSGNVRFDAARTDAGHSDEFWAKALADLAAETRPAARLADGYLADGKPLISPSAFCLPEVDWSSALSGMVF